MIKKIIFIFIVLSVPAMVSAHGGVSKNVGETIVFLNQSPLSPLVGEPVALNFIITDKNYQPLKQLPVKLTLSDTFPGDESKDKIILVQNLQTDNNGDFSFNYTFNKENYFDVDLDFKDPITGADNSEGFLIEPREAKPQNQERDILIALGFGFLLAWTVKTHWPGKRKTN